MIGTDEMSSTGMDISESFRAEDLSKTDFFDFVTAPDMGIGIGVSLHTHHHHHHHSERTSATHLSNGENNRCIPDDSSISDSGRANSNNSGDPTLQSYDQFWNSDKDHTRLESTIFEDLDRYCWQQHQQQQQQLSSPSQNLVPNLTSPASPIPQHLRTGISVNVSNTSHNNPLNTGNLTSNGSSSSISHTSSSGTTSTINNTDGQIYTITVLNGNEPWLKREPDTQLSNSLDLECLLGNFPGYIKTEYPYDDSGFSTDGTKDNNDVNGIVQSHLSLPTTVIQPSEQTLPSLVTALSATMGSTASVDQQFAQFQNNNNDWQMTDNNADQNSAESLLRSALQGKGYSKGLHLQNGLSLAPASPSVKNDDMRRILFPTEADSLDFVDSSLGTSQIFDDPQNSTHNVQNVLQSHTSTANRSQSASNNASSSTSASNVSSIIVDDMFLSLESAFSDDFEKIKRIANEVQQFCSSTPIATDYGSSDVLMQISPNPTALQQMHSPTTPICGAPPPSSQHIQQVTHPPPQPLKPEVTTSTTNRLSLTPPTKVTKKYKRTTSSTSSTTLTSQINNSNALVHSNNNNNSNTSRNCNNNSDSSISKNITSCSNNNVGSSGASSSSTGTSNSSGSPTHCNGQRKERSLHYCSICSKGFKDKYSVNVHIRTHTGEKPFACSLCGKSFRQKAHLAKHYQTHMAQKSNGSLIKSASSKQSRSTTTSLSSLVVGGGGGGATNASLNSAISSQQQRQLNVVSTAMVATAPTSIAPANGPASVLQSPNGLIANR